MTSYRKIFIERSMAYSFTSGVNVNILTLLPFDYMKTHSGSISNSQTITNHGSALTEVAFADVDVLLNVGKYAVSSTNAVTFALDKTSYSTEALALDFIEGLLIEYELNSTAFVGTDIYDCDSYLSNGTFLGEMVTSSLATISARIAVLDGGINPNSGGYPFHVVSRSRTPIL